MADADRTAPPPHYPEALPPTLSDMQLREGAVSVDATVASIDPPPTIVTSVNPADVASDPMLFFFFFFFFFFIVHLEVIHNIIHSP